MRESGDFVHIRPQSQVSRGDPRPLAESGCLRKTNRDGYFKWAVFPEWNRTGSTVLLHIGLCLHTGTKHFCLLFLAIIQPQQQCSGHGWLVVSLIFSYPFNESKKKSVRRLKNQCTHC